MWSYRIESSLLWEGALNEQLRIQARTTLMFYQLQVDLLVAIGILLAFFNISLVLMVLRLGYLATVRLVQMAKAHVSG